MLEELQTGYLMTYFVKHSLVCPKASQDDKNISYFLLRNLAKGIAITNTILVMGYLARFRTYRNSNLMRMHGPATLLGMYFTVLGT